jgi:hypothetical protein
MRCSVTRTLALIHRREGETTGAVPTFIRTNGEGIKLHDATYADQDFIADARQSLPPLLTEVRRLRARVAKLEAMLSPGVRAFDGERR